MAIPKISFRLPNNLGLTIHNVIPKPKTFLFFSSLSAMALPYSINGELQSLSLNRRLLLKLSISIHTSVLLWNPFGSSSSMATNEVLSLQRYTDSKEGFTLLRPSSWIQVDKAGATILFEEPNKGSNNVGIVVSPVRISILWEFGSPQFVAEKLIEAERRKESTKEAEVVSVSERRGTGGLQVYEIEYKVDSTRGGKKRIFAAAFVASKKLYLLNITHSDRSEDPLEMDRRMILEHVLHSFDIAPLT